MHGGKLKPLIMGYGGGDKAVHPSAEKYYCFHMQLKTELVKDLRNENNKKKASPKAGL